LSAHEPVCCNRRGDESGRSAWRFVIAQICLSFLINLFTFLSQCVCVYCDSVRVYVSRFTLLVSRHTVCVSDSACVCPDSTCVCRDSTCVSDSACVCRDSKCVRPTVCVCPTVRVCVRQYVCVSLRCLPAAAILACRCNPCVRWEMLVCLLYVCESHDIYPYQVTSIRMYLSTLSRITPTWYGRQTTIM
jgi:hypothetical protein